jgi:hypothetical protein
MFSLIQTEQKKDIRNDSLADLNLYFIVHICAINSLESSARKGAIF